MSFRVRFVLGCFASAAVLASGAARADIPAGYLGKPFDPAVAGGVGIIPTTVKAGPYALPGRLDFVNYDLGGELIAFHAGDHITNKAGAGYRKDSPVATFSKTSAAAHDVWYMSGTAMDGTTYPDATTQDFYIGAVQVNDWFNFTVNVQTAGTYVVSSTWSSGNGPPGGEGGDGSMGLQIYSNGTKLADWKSSFPNYNTDANFHNWKPYPAFATVTLPAGLQVIKLQSTSKHLNLDYVDFELTSGDGGTTAGAGGSPGVDAGATGAGGSTSTGAAGGVGSSGAAGSSATGGAGAVGASGAAGSTSSGAAGSSGASGAAGDTGGTGAAGTGAAGTTASGAAGTGGSTAGTGPAPKHASSGGCAYTSPTRGGWLAAGLAAVALSLARRRRRP